MKRRHFFVQLLAFSTALTSLLNARILKPFEFTASNQRKRVDKRWMHMNKSFDYYDYDFIDDMGFGMLRVIDEFTLDHLTGTPVHPHKKMEILTILLEGQIFHQDNFGNSGMLHAGDYQLMSAGSGLKHAETNPSQFDKVRGLQIWMSSKNRTGKPNYQQKNRDEIDLTNKLTVIASNQNDKAMHLDQDGQVLRGQFNKEQTLNYSRSYKGNGLYCFIIKGEVKLFKRVLKTGDGLGISKEEKISLEIKANSDFLLFDLPQQGEF